ncbi:hypothetical protein [uncultured Dialister sp.]|uniref:hypothetical protein n=1 Tax=uncultured Dialister sp. TaxID=278064 RepID=UPI0026589A22|nr:hypothetical protein [uncultured Dialister sp.]
MKKVLVLTEEFRAMTNATGVCTKAIVDTLAKENDVMVLSTIDSFDTEFPDEYDGIQVRYQGNEWWELKPNPNGSHLQQQASVILKKARNLLMKPFYPINSISPIVRFYRKACKLHKQYKFDIILCFFHPFESFIVGGLLKKRYPELRVVHYMLDTLMNYTPYARLLSAEFCHNRNLKLENWGYQHCDCIINLQVQKKFYDNVPGYNKYKKKMVYADIPLFKNRSGSELNNMHIVKGMMIYAGSLVKEFRNPSYALKLFSMMPKEYRTVFYCSGDCDDMVRMYAGKYEMVVMGGYIQHNLLEKKLEEAEVLINFGNYKLNMIPSKIFEYFSFGKKIIHFYKDDNDTCIPYLKKYPYALLLDERDALGDNLEKLLKFLSTDIHSDSDRDWSKAFYMNTPEYSSKLILGTDSE